MESFMFEFRISWPMETVLDTVSTQRRDTKILMDMVDFSRRLLKFTSWPLLGNEGMNPQYTNVKVDSLIPYG